MTAKEITKFVKLLQNAEKLCEQAGQMVCSIPGKADVWSKCGDAARACAAAIHDSYKLSN